MFSKLRRVTSGLTSFSNAQTDEIDVQMINGILDGEESLSGSDSLLVNVLKSKNSSNIFPMSKDKIGIDDQNQQLANRYQSQQDKEIKSADPQKGYMISIKSYFIVHEANDLPHHDTNFKSIVTPRVTCSLLNIQHHDWKNHNCNESDFKHQNQSTQNKSQQYNRPKDSSVIFIPCNNKAITSLYKSNQGDHKNFAQWKAETLIINSSIHVPSCLIDGNPTQQLNDKIEYNFHFEVHDVDELMDETVLLGTSELKVSITTKSLIEYVKMFLNDDKSGGHPFILLRTKKYHLTIVNSKSKCGRLTIEFETKAVGVLKYS